MAQARKTSQHSSYYERPITSERAELVRDACPQSRTALRNFLATGEATLLAVANAYYNGDIVADKWHLYGIVPGADAPTAD